jgi:AbrB family looped-hinge helix DNA binding protein
MIRFENTSRRIDALGRITIPKAIRDRMFITENDDLAFYTLTLDGVEYVCLTKSGGVDPKYFAARAVLEELGVEIPAELEAACQ